MATAQGRNPRSEAQESFFCERCWRYRAVVPNGLVCRRTIKTSHSTGTHIGTVVAYTHLDHYEAVSLCGVCDTDIAAEEKAEYERDLDRSMGWVRAIGGIWGTLCLSAVGVPVPLGLMMTWCLARLRIIGRCVVMMHGSTLVGEKLGWLPERHAAVALTAWGAAISGCVVWQMTHADRLKWPFAWLVRNRLSNATAQTERDSHASLPTGG